MTDPETCGHSSSEKPVATRYKVTVLSKPIPKELVEGDVQPDIIEKDLTSEVIYVLRILKRGDCVGILITDDP